MRLLVPAIVTVLLIVVYQGLSLSSSVRAYVGGESFWAKGQKQAVQFLYRYALTHDEADYHRYQEALVVPFADRRGRLEFQRPNPDVDAAARWFVAGKNHPDDAKPMVLLVIRYGWVSYIRRAIEIWTAGDAAIAGLVREGTQLHALIRSGTASSQSIRPVLDRIAARDAELTALEADFSLTLGDGARWLTQVAFTVVLVVGAVLVWLGVAVSNRMLQYENAARDRDIQLRQAQKMDAVGRLAGGVAHDFNNVLTVIRGNIDLVLRDRSVALSQNAELLQSAHEAAVRATTLTKQLLTFSRKQVAQRTVLRIDTAVHDMLPMLTRLIGEDVHLMEDHDPSTPAIQADAGHMGQVLLNLAVNARDAMPYGGTLTIRTRPADSTSGYAVLRERGRHDITRWALLEVTDTGVGMDNATLAQIFEPFFTTKGVNEGTGLGLSTVYGIVKQHSGEIAVESAVDAGTTVRIFFPATAASVAAPVAAPVQARLARSEETILLVEDDKSVRTVLSLILKQHGYHVIEARDGMEALDHISEHHVDLVLSDVVMPRLGGRAMIEELGRRGFDVPVVFMSGHTNDENPLKDMRGRDALFVHKSFEPDELCRILQRTLASHRGPAVA